ncbi:MAG: type VI secretion system-associated FHA domain protein TagH [Arenibacterium sp.]
MPVTLKFQSSGMVPGNVGPAKMQGGSLTVGRGPANDMVLPDPDRLLSKNHFVIEDHNGNVVIVDLSTNGTFLNYSKIPLGNSPTPLNDGDVLELGNYELIVEIKSDNPSMSDLIAPPLEEGGISHGSAERAPDPMELLDAPTPGGGDFLDDLLGPETPTGPSQLNPADPIDDLLPPMGEDEDPFFNQPSDGREGTGASIPMHGASAHDSFRPQATGGGSNLIPDDWDDMLEGVGGPEPAPPPRPTPQPAAPPPAAPARRTPPVLPPESGQERTTLPPGMGGSDATPSAPPADAPAEPSASASAAPSAEQSDLAMAFIKGMGAEDANIKPEDMASTMARMGRVMKTLVTGLREILMTRTSIKSEFRIEQTMISAGGNNPLKFSISPEQAIETMVQPATKGYLSPETAVEEALHDIKAHEIAMVTGMEAALKGVLRKLDPEQLAGQIESKGGLGSLLKGKKARYWEVYEKMYADISDQAENDFHDLFSREFARAYKNQLDKLKK